MKVSSSYIHALEGRLRIKVPEVKDAPPKAREVQSHLAGCPGVEEVCANPITGSVLILYNPRLVGQEELVFALQEIDCLQEPHLQSGKAAAGPEGAFGKMATAVASSLMEVALTRLVAAFI